MADLENTTVEGLWKTITGLKISTLIGLITLTTSLISGIFMAGRYSNQKEIAIELNAPFDLKITTGQEYKNLVLVPNSTLLETSEKLKAYTIKQVEDEFDDKPVGTLVVHQIKKENK